MAWEFGANLGHLARLKPVADLLRADGHTAIFAVRDTATASKLLGAPHYRFIQAPIALSRPRVPLPPSNYSEILLAEGFHDPLALAGRIKAWLTLFELIRPDALLLDHSPTALLAAYIANIPHVAMGTGFEIPPMQSPFPTFRPWEQVKESRLRKSDQAALYCINTALNHFGSPALEAPCEMFSRARRLLATFAELDHYGGRRNESYIGPLFAQLDGPTPSWPGAGGARILAYLRPEIAGFSAMVDALKEQGTPTILVAPGTTNHWIANTRSAFLKVYNSPLNIMPLLKDCSLGISYGGSGSLSQFALSGVPQLVMPQNAEQNLGAIRLASHGAGFLIEARRDKLTIQAGISRVLAGTTYHEASKTLAKKYSGFLPSQATQAIVASLIR